MQIAPLLHVGRGVTAIIGGGGKTTLMETLAGELSKKGKVIITTTTHICRPKQYETLLDADEAAVSAALERSGIVCVASRAESGKLCAPWLSMGTLAQLADFVLVEADGAKRLPLKAHASHEPVIPEEVQRVIMVIGIDGVGKTIRETCHRSALYAQLAGVDEETVVTPQLAARVVNAEGYGDRVYINKVESAADYEAAQAMANEFSCPVIAGSLHQGGYGAGDIASGAAMRLWRCGIDVVMTDLARPTAIRRTVAFSDAIVHGETTVEGLRAVRAENAAEAKKLLREGSLPVLADPECACREELAPDALVDAILAKRNLGTKIDDAPIVVGVGPGFTAGEDCHAVVETMRGHTLGRVIYSGSALPNTNIPGLIGGFAGERVLRAPCDGIFTAVHRIGDTVEEGETIGFVEGQPMKCTISGVLRGVLDDGVPVKKGMKSGDVDPRCKPEYCTTISDKALAVGGGVVEAVLYLRAKQQGRR